MVSIAERPIPVAAAMRQQRGAGHALVGQLGMNQGRLVFIGQLTFQEFESLSIACNRRWAAETGDMEVFEEVTQRELDESHCYALASFIGEGVVSATIKRIMDEGLYEKDLIEALEHIKNVFGQSVHFGLPPLILATKHDLTVTPIKLENGEVVGYKLLVPSGVYFSIADGQHRREAFSRFRQMLEETIQKRHTPKASKVYSVSAPLSAVERQAWVEIQTTFQESRATYEAHLGLSVEEARQLFSNFNSKVKPVATSLNLEFDTSNPANQFGKQLLENGLLNVRVNGESRPLFDYRQMASINSFVLFGKTTIKNSPSNIDRAAGLGKDFWQVVTKTAEWKREDSLLRTVPVLKGLGKCWYKTHIAKPVRDLEDGAKRVENLIRNTVFDAKWVNTVDGLNPYFTAEGRWAPAHNDIAGRIYAAVLPETTKVWKEMHQSPVV